MCFKIMLILAKEYLNHGYPIRLCILVEEVLVAAVAAMHTTVMILAHHTSPVSDHNYIYKIPVKSVIENTIIQLHIAPSPR